MPGSWQALASQPTFNASTMLLLTDGTVMCQESGGTAWWRLTPDEWGDYANGTWSPLAPMTDSRLYYASAVLADGRVFVAGGEYHNGAQVDWNQVEVYDPVTDGWQPAATPGWIHVGDAPCCVLPDGKVLLGSIDDTRTAIYEPGPDPAAPGTWTAGPDFPDSPPGQLLKANDAPGCVLPNGHVLCVAGTAPDAGGFAQDGQFFEFDGKLLDPAPAPGNAGGNVYEGRMLLLPTGQVLFSAGSPAMQIYTPVGEPDDEWRPRIAEHPRDLRPGHSYVLHGERFNGMTQAVAYGDDATMATNYPIVRLTGEDGRVRYARTFDHSTMAVATGHRHVHTRFTCPAGLPAGRYDLRVVANGIASREAEVRVL